MNSQAAVPERDAYSEVVSAIRRTGGSLVSVPHLSSLLGVKTTTLNARFRREKAAVRTVGRTNFISHELALRLAELHKYALFGWLTLKLASQLTGVKSATIKARCETGHLEGHIDLTKRLRIAPSALESLGHVAIHKASEPRGAKRNGTTVRLPAVRQAQEPLRPSGNPNGDRVARYADRISTTPRPVVLPPPPAPQIRIITRKDYGLPEIEESTQAGVETLKAPRSKRKQAGCLSYDPERPFSVSECAVGRHIRYAQYDGTILGIIDDPFNPQIKAAFPEHQHPLMREVLLIVGRRRG